MPVSWFIAKFTVTIQYPIFPYALRTSPIDDVTLAANGATFRHVELNDRLIYKINASNGVLNAVAALSGVTQLPTNILDNPLSNLTANQRQALVNELQDQGYTAQQITDQFPNFANTTLRQVLKFMARTFTLPAWDDTNKLVIQSAQPQDTLPCNPDIDTIDGAV